MSKTVQFKRGNANVSASYVGAQGEITVNTDNYTLNVHDGTTPGGYSILNTNVSNIGNLVVTNQTIIGTSTNADITLSPTNANVVLTSNLVTPNIVINRNTIQSIDGETSLKLPATSDGANVELVNNFSNIKFTVLDADTDEPHTLTLDRDSYLTVPGYIRSTLGGGEIQFGGTQGVLIYADFGTGHTGISLSDIGTTDIFANGDLRLSSNYSGSSKQWTLSTNGTFSSSGNLSTANLLISHVAANNTVQARTLSNSDLKLTATDGTYESSIYLWANNQRMSFNTVSNAFDFNFNGQLSATDFTASKNSNVGYSFYAEGGDYSGFRHTSGPPDLITIVHEGNVFAGFYGNYTTQLYGNLVVSSDGETFGSFPDAYVQVYSNVDSYSQFVLQNINDGSSASTDIVVTADNGNDSTYYINMGILGSNHAAPDFFGDIQCFDDGYLLVVGNDATGGAANVGNLLLGSTNGVVKTFVGNIAQANVVTTVSEGLLNVAGNVAATYFIGDGSQLTGLTTSTNIVNGTSSISIPTANGNIYVGVNNVGSTEFTSNGINTLSLHALVDITAAGNISATKNITAIGNLAAGNIATALVTTTSDIITPNININSSGDIVYSTGFNHNGETFTSPESNGPLNSFKWKFSDLGVGSDTITLQWNLLDTTFSEWYLSTGSQANIFAFDGSTNTIGFVSGGNNSGTLTFGTSANNGAGGYNDIELTSATGDVYLRSGIDSWKFDNNGTLTAPGDISTSGNIIANVNGYSIGYLDIPQVTFSSNATLSLTDSGKHYYSANSANVITIPNNSTVSFNIGTAVSIVQQGTANLTISPDSGVTLYLTGNSTPGARTLGNYGMATLLKVATDTWFISGTGVN